MEKLQLFTNKILNKIDAGEFDEALDLIQSWLVYDENCIDMYILKAEVFGCVGDIDRQMETISQGLSKDMNNYELFFIRARLLGKLHQEADAYLSYEMALYLCNNEEDRKIISVDMNEFCNRADTSNYELGESLKKIIIFRISNGENARTYEFMTNHLYTSQKELGRIWLTENNMLLYMMLEITTCNINDEEVIHFDIKEYLGNVKFHENYIKIKFLARRIWFGFYNATYELADFLVIHKISADMAAVIIKYSLPKWMVVEAIEKVSDALVERHSTLSDELRKYAIWLTNATSTELTRIKYGKFQFERTQSEWKKLREFSDKIHIIDLDLSVLSVASIQTEKLNNHKFAFIMCVNDDNYCEEVIAYIKCLDMPKGYVADIINVRNAKGMAAGYNIAMRLCDARYKIYLHQDTFIINPNFLHDLLNIYNKENAPSMIGAAGCNKLSPEGIWWNSNSQDVRMTWYQDGILTILESNSAGTCDDEKEINAGYKEVSCLDGILIATSQDIPWREDLFDGWHFYDISQGFEFKKNNLKVACIVARDMCIVHETTMRKDPSNAYEYYRKIFLKEYQTLLN